MQQVGLILEGGGMRGSFTAGVLDFFMREGLYLPYVIGVSAGAANGVNYVSRQPGRYQACTKTALSDYRYISPVNLLHKKGYFDLDIIYDILPYTIPLDFKTLFASKSRFLITVTDCESGQAQYLAETSEEKRLLALLRASCSLPFITPMVRVDGHTYLDGGIADSIPIEKARADGYRRNIVVLTRDQFYRKKEKHAPMSALYHRYPKLGEAINARARRYNQTLERLKILEKSGEVFVLRPESEVKISRAEKDIFKIDSLYWDGFNHAKRNFRRLCDWLDAK